MTRTVVVTDSSACLPRDLAERLGVRVAPLSVIVDGEPQPEGVGISPVAVVEALVAGRRVGTSQPTPDAVRAALADAAASGADAAVALSLSARMSGTLGAFEAAAADAPVPVTVVDSRTVSLALGLAALSAAAVAAGGGAAAEVAAEARRASRASMCLFTVDTLDYLRRGGRVSPAVAALGNALGVKPVLGVIDGEVAQVERVRTSARARQAVVDRIASRAAAMRHPVVGVMGLPGDEAVREEALRALSTRGDWPSVTADLSAALAAHAGPGALALAVVDAHPALVEALAG